MNSYHTPPRCPFPNKSSSPVLEFLKLWGCRKKNVGVQEEEAESLTWRPQCDPINPFISRPTNIWAIWSEPKIETVFHLRNEFFTYSLVILNIKIYFI